VEIAVRRAEQAIQAAVCEHLRRRAQTNVFWCAVPNGGWRTKSEARIFVGLGVTPGVPDLLAVHRGRTFGLEIKAPGGRLSAVQRSVHAALCAAGADVATAWSLDEALAVLERWGLLRGRVQ
jgi:hypothetical protein